MDQSVMKFMKPKFVLNPEVYEVAAQIVLKGHSRYSLAKDVLGRNSDPDSPLAVMFCSQAAIAKGVIQVEKVDLSMFSLSACIHREAFENFLGKGINICEWNNDPLRTPEEIASTFREFAKTL